MDCSTPGFPVLPYLSEFAQTQIPRQGCHANITPSVGLFSSCPQSFPASGSFPMSQIFESGSQSIGASVHISPSNEYSGLTSIMIDWFDLFAVPGTLKSLLQQHSSKASIFWPQPSSWSNSHICTWLLEKAIPLTLQIFVCKAMSLPFNTLSRFVKIFLPRSKHLLILWLQSPYIVILEPKKIKPFNVFLFPHLSAMKWWDWMPIHDLHFLNVEF